MRDLSLNTAAKCLFVLAHGVFYAMACAVPLMLVWQTFWPEGGSSAYNWSDLLSDWPRWRVLLGNTLIVGTVAVSVAVILGASLALLAFKVRWRGAGLLVALLLLLACTPTYVTSSALFGLLDVGAARGSAALAGLIHGLMYFPLASVLIGLGLLFVESELEEAALLETQPRTVLLKISLLRAWWSIAAAGLIVMWFVLTDYSVTNILQVRTFPEEVYTQYRLWGQRTPSLLVSLPVLFILATGFWMLQRLAGVLSTPLFQGQAARPFRISLRPSDRMPAAVILLVLLSSVCGMMVLWITRMSSLGSVWITLQAILPDWWNTIVIASATGALVSGSAMSIAWIWARLRRWRVLTGLMLLLLISTPSPTLAIVLISSFSRREPAWLMDALQPFYNSLWADVLVLWLRFLPVGVLLMLPAIKRVTQAVDDAAQADGAGWFERAYHIYWPAGRAQATLVGLVILLLSISELDCVHLVSPPGIETLSGRLFSFIHAGVETQVATVCLVSMLSAAAPAAWIFIRSRRTLLHHTDAPGS